MRKLMHLMLLVFSFFTSYSQTKITAQEASKHIGDSVIVLDKVYGGKLLGNGMTLLNVGGEFPNHLLVVMIKPEDRVKFSYKPEEYLKGKQVIVSGKLIDYKGKPEIIITEPNQIEVTIVADPKLNLKKQ